MIVKPFQLDKSKVKRFFAFGCSFTSHMWPTWADIMAVDLDCVEYYNCGITGIGNLGITCKISEANTRYHFNENDLIMVMWSTFLREDRWINGGWLGAGNVYNNDLYDNNFRKKFSDVCGYLIRDTALISLSTKFLQNTSSQCISMYSVPIGFLEQDKEYNSEVYQAIQNLYCNLFDSMPKSLFDTVKINDSWPTGHTYYWEELNQMHQDPHPSPVTAANYLNDNITTLSEKAQSYSLETYQQLLNCKTKREICSSFDLGTRRYNFF